MNSTFDLKRTMKDWALKVKALRQQTLAEVGRVVVGMEQVTQQLLIALLAAGHVLLEGVPGVAKTTLSKTFAHILGIQYQRCSSRRTCCPPT